MIDAIEQNLLREVADLDSLPVGAYNIRANGQLAGRNTTANIDIVTKDRQARHRHPHHARSPRARRYTSPSS